MDLAIIPECYVDTNLIETIVPPQNKGYNHQKGCSNVTRLMQKNFADSFALGIIDRDKSQVDYLNEFAEVINSTSLILHKHKTKHHYIIQINPAIETFLLKNANLMDISLEDYGLPSNFDELKKESKQEQSKKDHRFKNLFRAIQNAGSEDFLRLANWIEYLRDHPYNATVESLNKM